MNHKAFQDYYPDELNYCYGCGRLNEQGKFLLDSTYIKKNKERNDVG